jgi:membrane-associated phospholipid phosphatase
LDLNRQRSRVLTLLAGLVGLFLVLTLLVVAGWTQSVDDSWNQAMADLELPWLVNMAEAFHHIGGVSIAFLTVTSVAIIFVATRRWWFAGAWLAIVGVTQVLTTITKTVVGRDRPLDALVHESSAAYPSGHASVSGAAIAIGLAVLAGFLWPQRYRLFLLVGVAYAVAMAWSRTYLHAHWLTDVVSGLLLGTAVVCVVALTMADRLTQRPGEPGPIKEP